MIRRPPRSPLFPYTPLFRSVEKTERPAPDVAILNLRLPMNENFRFLAGQYIDFLLKDGKRRSYSIANPPRAEGVTALELHVRHTPGGAFTDQVFSSLKIRDLLRFEGPLGTFFLREESDKPIVMVASGTGFAPIKAMCESALQRGLKREMTLYWGCRAKRDLYMLDVPQGWKADNFRFVPVLSDPTPECQWSEEHTSELQSQSNLVCRLLLEKKKNAELDLQP